MHRNYFLVIVLISVFCLVLIFVSLFWQIQAPVTKEPGIPPPLAPFKTSISGVGIVEPSSDNIMIGSPLSRIIENVKVKVGDHVKKGDILLTLEDRDLQANLKVQVAAYKSAMAKLQKLEAYPRPEDLTAATAALNSAKAEMELAKTQYEMVQGLPDPRAISQQEKNRRLFNFQQAEAKLQSAQADFDKVKAGSWKPDIDIAHRDVEEASANVNLTKTELERTVIRSPIDGTVLQIKIHKGELIPPDSLRSPLMIIGNTDELYLRVSINQLDIPYFQPDEPAVAYSQGDARIKYPLEFVHIDPYLTHKKNLTNEILETVDTNVLQVIYRIKKDDHTLYVGQQMDVFIETKDAAKQ